MINGKREFGENKLREKKENIGFNKIKKNSWIVLMSVLNQD